MAFYFSAYSTPLLFGFVQGWVYAILLWVRGYREERLSDKLLGGVLVALCFEIWVYMLGFGGIEILWRQLEFFPRDLGYLLGPLIYFYLKSQFDSTFRFRLRDGWHALPFIVHWVYHVTVFAQGPSFVQQWETNVHNPLQIGNIEFVVLLVQQYLYLYLSFQLYRGYRQWIKHQFSETDTISFRWYRNFLIALIVTATISLIVTLVDMWLDLSFWQDWWGNLAAVVLIYYVSIEGYAQAQLTRKLVFRPELINSDPVIPENHDLESIEGGNLASIRQPNVPTLSADQEKVTVLLPDLPERLSALLSFMTSEKP
ncbi:MAG: AraC family transcriptional regulator, partial [Cytophagaceae bacterium]